MAKTKEYTSKDIKILSDREHVRQRLSLYAGNTKIQQYSVPLFINETFVIKTMEFVPATFKCVGEIFDNSIDEFSQIDQSNKQLTISAIPSLGTYTISDNGRGVPIDKHESGKYTPEVVFNSLRSGRNFDDDKTTGVIGLNGMGAAISNYCSTEFAVEIVRDKKMYRQAFYDGGSRASKPKITKATSKHTQTSVSFKLDPDVFEDYTLPEELVQNKAIELTLTNPDITVSYNKQTYKYKNGFDQLIKKLSNKYHKFTYDDIEVFVIFDLHQGDEEYIFSWCNSSLLFEGGLCNTQILNSFYDKVASHLESKCKKDKSYITKNDIKPNLLLLCNIKLSNPEYDQQSKVRLIGPSLRKQFDEMIDSQWQSFVKKHKDWLETVFERASQRTHTTENKKALKQHKKNSRIKIPDLIDATNKDRSTCQLLVTEGASASSQITEVRNPATTGALPLTGKINNVYGATIAQLLKMSKVTNLLSAIGLIPGEPVDRKKLRYGKVILATDADQDGGDVFSLLVNLFYQFWPELFEDTKNPFIYRLLAPNVVVSKKDKRIHFVTHEQYEKQKNKYAGWTVDYMKGLASMTQVDWEMILSGKNDTLIPIVEDGKIKDTLELLFSSNIENRKKWLT